ncbi:prostate stem cell antigen-like [Hypanus sabinus]|uniref:prostate stem cell antigen-like n=1 Tax=Hypanus sabinus TaxID=79690 RepID=UPI0028C4EEF3|nr:prostate stem cell antigen-like [Hypanus sabinus]
MRSGGKGESKDLRMRDGRLRGKIFVIGDGWRRFICLCSVQIAGLKCYSCKDETSNKNCNSNPVQNCSGNEDRCSVSKFTMNLFGIQTTVLTKGCIAKSLCTGNINVLFVNTGVKCCESDLCNVNGAINFSARKLLLMASASFLYFIYKLTNEVG